MRLRELMILEAKKVTFRGRRMSSSERRAMAGGLAGVNKQGGVVRLNAEDATQLGMTSAARPAGRNKPTAARLRKAGVVVPNRAGLKRADRLAQRRGKLVAAKNKPPRKPRARRSTTPRASTSVRMAAMGGMF